MFQEYIDSFPEPVKELMLQHQEDFMGYRNITKFYKDPTIPKGRFLWDQVPESRAWRLLLDVKHLVMDGTFSSSSNLSGRTEGFKLLFDAKYE